MLYRIPHLLDCLETFEQKYVHYSRMAGGYPLGLIQYGWHRTPPCYGYGPSSRDHYLFHFIKSGRGEVTVSEQRFEVYGGQLFLIFPHQVTYYESDAEDPWTYYWIGFEGEWGRRILEKAQLDEDHPIADIPKPDELFPLLAKMGEAMGDKDGFLQLNGLLYQILYLLRDASGKMPMPELFDFQDNADLKADDRVNTVISIIENSYGENISVRALAEQMGFSRTYLTNVFKEKTGMSIKEYLTEHRLNRAKLMMMNVGLSVKEIALSCGYRDPLFFSRMFKKRFGISPTDYKNSLKGKRHI